MLAHLKNPFSATESEPSAFIPNSLKSVLPVTLPPPVKERYNPAWLPHPYAVFQLVELPPVAVITPVDSRAWSNLNLVPLYQRLLLVYPALWKLITMFPASLFSRPNVWSESGQEPSIVPMFLNT